MSLLPSFFINYETGGFIFLGEQCMVELNMPDRAWFNSSRRKKRVDGCFLPPTPRMSPECTGWHQTTIGSTRILLFDTKACDVMNSVV